MNDIWIRLKRFSHAVFGVRDISGKQTSTTGSLGSNLLPKLSIPHQRRSLLRVGVTSRSSAEGPIVESSRLSALEGRHRPVVQPPGFRRMDGATQW